MAVISDRRIALQEQHTAIEKERNMTVGKVQARSGKVPAASELEALAAAHPPPPPMGEVAVDDRTVDELLIALAHLTKRSSQTRSPTSGRATDHRPSLRCPLARPLVGRGSDGRWFALWSASAEIQMEQQKAEQWKIENRRRKHNYVPFIVNMLKLLAERGELMPLVDAAKSRKKARSGH